MREIKDVDSLSKDELITALWYTNTEHGETPQMARDVLAYYQLLSIDALKAKIKGPLYMPTEHRKVSQLEVKRRAFEEQHTRKIIRTATCVKDVDVPVVQKRDRTLEAIAAVGALNCVREVTEVCSGIIGVKLNVVMNIDKYKAAVEKAADGVEVIYG